MLVDKINKTDEILIRPKEQREAEVTTDIKESRDSTTDPTYIKRIKIDIMNNFMPINLMT